MGYPQKPEMALDPQKVELHAGWEPNSSLLEQQALLIAKPFLQPQNSVLCILISKPDHPGDNVCREQNNGTGVEASWVPTVLPPLCKSNVGL